MRFVCAVGVAGGSSGVQSQQLRAGRLHILLAGQMVDDE
jgi:hypothetical protein